MCSSLTGRRWCTDNCLLPTTHLFFIQSFFKQSIHHFTVWFHIFGVFHTINTQFLIVNQAACNWERCGRMLFCFIVISRAGSVYSTNGTYFGMSHKWDKFYITKNHLSVKVCGSSIYLRHSYSTPQESFSMPLGPIISLLSDCHAAVHTPCIALAYMGLGHRFHSVFKEETAGMKNS